MGRLNRSFRHINSDMERLVHLAAGSEDLTLMHWYVLVCLLEDATCKQVNLRSHADIPAPYLTKLLDQLVARDLVRRDRCPRDRRQFLLALTRAGRIAGLSMLESLHGVTRGHHLNALGNLQRLLSGFILVTDEPARTPLMK